MSLLMDIQTNRCWARVDFLATGEIVLHIPEECELPIRVLVSRGGRSTEYEPKSSEKPNNSTISKMEQVDKDINVRSKDEPQTMLNDGTLVINVEDATKVSRVLVGDDKNRGDLYYPDDEDEPQTDCAWGKCE